MKKTIIILLILAALGAAFFYFEPSKSNTAPADNPMLLQSWMGTSGHVVRAENYVLRTQDEWLKAWAKTDQSVITQPLLKNQMAVALFSGEHLTSGYLIRVIDAVETEYATKVVYQDLKPSQTRLEAAPYNTYPWTIVILPANSKPVIFEKASSALWYKAVKTVTGLFDSIFVSGFNSKVQE